MIIDPFLYSHAHVSIVHCRTMGQMFLSLDTAGDRNAIAPFWGVKKNQQQRIWYKGSCCTTLAEDVCIFFPKCVIGSILKALYFSIMMISTFDPQQSRIRVRSCTMWIFFHRPKKPMLTDFGHCLEFHRVLQNLVF